jgi:uncharacterized protein
MKPDFAQYGFAHQRQLIMAFIGGSQAHGAKLGATDDTDWYGLYIPPSDKVLGLEREEHFVFTTGGKFGGNGPSDVDVCLYTLIKWAGLAARGNPSALHFLFAPLEFTTETWKRVAARPEIFLAKGHVKPFLGFADDQMKRLLGQKGQKNIHRAELEKMHGYDTKYAMHVIRLYGEAIELMKDGRITLPRPNSDELVKSEKASIPWPKFKSAAGNWSQKRSLPSQLHRFPTGLIEGRSANYLQMFTFNYGMRTESALDCVATT